VREVHDFFEHAPEDVKGKETEVISRVETAYKMLCRDASAQDISSPLGNWLSEYFRYAPQSSMWLLDLKYMILRSRIVALEDAPLWDIWYTGSTPFPSEVLNN
jgi:origin recognition complex subunit 3